MTEGTIGLETGPELGTFCSRLANEAPELASSYWVAQAPICLDLMGGIAEYTGSLTISTPTSTTVQVAASPRDDQQLSIVVLDQNGNASVAQKVFALAAFYGVDGDLLSPSAMRSLVSKLTNANVTNVVAVAAALLEQKLVPHLAGGLTVVVSSEGKLSRERGVCSAVRSAVASAMAAALGVEIDRSVLASACMRSADAFAGHPCGIASQASPLLSEPGKLLQIKCQPFELSSQSDMPAGTTVVGIDTGTKHNLAERKFVEARVAAYMGREIIKRIMASSGGNGHWDGYLARLTIADYVERYRDKLPTKLKGSVYLDRFGQLSGELLTIDPNGMYKVRSRTEHHIYENDRVRQFADRIGRANRVGDRRALAEAGELMYCSHWSYGQRCGLGGVETDILVTALRTEGENSGVLGARVSGSGAGGVVVAFLEDTEQAHEAVQRAINTYVERAKREAVLMNAARPDGVGFTLENRG